MFRAAIPSQNLSIKKKSYIGGSIWIVNLMHMAFHNRYNAESFMLLQLHSVLFGHNYLVTNGKQLVNVLVNKVN